jgi:hypothetical protein
MGTTIHAHTPDKKNPTNTFFFDEIYMKACHAAKSTRKINSCPGVGYFKYIIKKHDEIYRRYNNGIEGIRVDVPVRCPHEVKRSPPPLPNHSSTDQSGKWHYHRLNDTPEEYANVENRKPDDFNPHAQLLDFVESAGNPDIRKNIESDGSVVVTDENRTWQKLLDGLNDFVKVYCGKDLETIVRKEVEQKYLQKLRKLNKKLERMNVKPTEENLAAIQTGALTIKITKQKIPSALPWNGNVKTSDGSEVQMTNTCTVDNGLYIVHVLLTSRADLEVSFKESNNSTYKLLYKIHKLFQSRKYAQGKYIWFQQFTEFTHTLTINSFGGEDQFFFSKFRDTTSTVFQSSYNNGSCPQPASVHYGVIITFSPAESCQLNSLGDAVAHWFKNEKTKPCTQMSTGNMRCSGVRTYEERCFMENHPPPLIPIDISNCPFHINDELIVKDARYRLLGVTYGSGGHFIATVRMGCNMMA